MKENENGKPALLDAMVAQFNAQFYRCPNDAQKQRALESALAVLTRPYEEEPLLSLQEIAKHLEVDPSTAWRWKLPWREWRGVKRYLASECEAYLASDAFKNRRQLLNAMRQCEGAPVIEQNNGNGANTEKKRRGRPRTTRA